MAEVEWVNCTDPMPMLRFLPNRAIGRKLRLFTCACCRRVWPFLPDQRSREAVEVAERYADGMASDERLALARDAARQPYSKCPIDAVLHITATAAFLATRGAVRLAAKDAAEVTAGLVRTF